MAFRVKIWPAIPGDLGKKALQIVVKKWHLNGVGSNSQRTFRRFQGVFLWPFCERSPAWRSQKHPQNWFLWFWWGSPWKGRLSKTDSSEKDSMEYCESYALPWRQKKWTNKDSSRIYPKLIRRQNLSRENGKHVVPDCWRREQSEVLGPTWSVEQPMEFSQLNHGVGDGSRTVQQRGAVSPLAASEISKFPVAYWGELMQHPNRKIGALRYIRLKPHPKKRVFPTWIQQV